MIAGHQDHGDPGGQLEAIWEPLRKLFQDTGRSVLVAVQVAFMAIPAQAGDQHDVDGAGIRGGTFRQGINLQCLAPTVEVEQGGPRDLIDDFTTTCRDHQAFALIQDHFPEVPEARIPQYQEGLGRGEEGHEVTGGLGC